MISLVSDYLLGFLMLGVKDFLMLWSQDFPQSRIFLNAGSQGFS
jgi:hypothetical protein